MIYVRNICLSLAGLFLLLHTILPHEHHSQIDDQEHLSEYHNDSSILDIISLAFHFDQGSGHLEKYKTAANAIPIVFVESSVNIDFNLLSSILELPQIIFQTEQNLLHDRLFTTKLRFRGPPITT